MNTLTANNIRFTPTNRIVRVLKRGLGCSAIGTKYFVEDVSSDGRYLIATPLITNGEINPASAYLIAAEFKLLMTCEPRLIGMHPDHGAPYGEQS